MVDRSKLLALLTAGLLAAGLVAGCGEKSEPEAPAELSRNQLIEQGDAICERARGQVREATSTPVNDAAGNARLVGELISISQREIDGLEALEAPSELDEPLARYLAARQEALDLLRDARSAAEEDEAFEFARIQAEIADSQPERTRLAGEVGFMTCSRVGDTAEVPEQDDQQGGKGNGSGNGSGNRSSAGGQQRQNRR